MPRTTHTEQTQSLTTPALARSPQCQGGVMPGRTHSQDCKAYIVQAMGFRGRCACTGFPKEGAPSGCNTAGTAQQQKPVWCSMPGHTGIGLPKHSCLQTPYISLTKAHDQGLVGRGEQVLLAESPREVFVHPATIPSSVCAKWNRGFAWGTSHEPPQAK